jgi:hypothetical protein
MKLFGMIGSIIATDIGYTVSIIMIFIAIRKTTDYQFSLLGQQIVHILAYTGIMALIIKIIFMLTGGAIPGGRLPALMITLLAVLIGAAVYLTLAKWTGLLRRISGGTRLSVRKRG